MALSNTAVPTYYGQFRDAVVRGEIPVNREISLEMNRIDALITNPNLYYDDLAVEGFIRFCEGEMTLTDGSDLHLLFTFKLWSEQLFGWYYYVERSVYVPSDGNHGGHYEKRTIKIRLVKKQYLIVAREDHFHTEEGQEPRRQASRQVRLRRHRGHRTEAADAHRRPVQHLPRGEGPAR